MANYLSDIITYVRRIIKSPSNSVITDALIVDYINRFYLMDMDARLQLFDLKTTYQFQTSPGIDTYNMPLYDVQTSSDIQGFQNIGMFPVYQGFSGPAYVSGIEMPFYTQRSQFYNVWPSYNQTVVQVGTGDGSAGPYTLTLPFLPSTVSNSNSVNSAVLRGHVDIAGIIATGNNVDPPLDTAGDGALIGEIPSTSITPQVYFTSTATDNSSIVVCDTGIFLQSDQNYGLLMAPGTAPYGNSVLAGAYSTTQNTINYVTGVATNVTFPKPIASGTPINAQCVYYQTGIPRAVLFYNNALTLRAPPNTQYLIQLDAFLTPAAFFSTSQAASFGYMCEYIARGAARKILSDTGDIEQFNFYEQFFKEQELLVWKRSQRQWTATRTPTIYSGAGFAGNYNQSSFGV